MTRVAIGDRSLVVVNLITELAALPHAIAQPPLAAFESLALSPDDCTVVDFHATRWRTGTMPPFRLADGPIQVGAVVLDVGGATPSIERFLPAD